MSIVVEPIGIDEQAFRKGHSYIALIYDLDRSTVEAIAMDMSAADERASKENTPLTEERLLTIVFAS